MLQIRLNKGSASDGGTGAKPIPVETVTVACPDHLVLADLPVAKGLGSATAASRLKIVGRRSRRQLGERVHFCVRCDFPIAIYGRLNPCEHAFCLDCARSDSLCYLCDERIQKIQTIKMMEGIYICAAPHCLKSFLKKTEFESHIHESHADLLQPSMRKEEMNNSESSGPKQFASLLDSSARASPKRPSLPPNPNSQPNEREREDRARRQHSRDTPPRQQLMLPKQPPYHPSDLQADGRSQGHGFGQFPDKQKQQPLYLQAPSNVPNQLPPPPPPFGFPPLPSDGTPPFYPFPYEVSRSDAAAAAGSDPGSLPGFPPLPSGPANNPESFPHHWSGPSMTGVPYEVMQGDYGRNSSGLPLSSPSPPMEAMGLLSSQPMPPPPPPPQGPPPAYVMQQQKHSGYPSSDSIHDAKNYGWQQIEKRESLGSNQD
ncbi:hypothetical protein Dimus_032452 [Dionaea muscipula]